jgi:hypothetical protein
MELAAIARWADTATFAGTVHRGASSTVGVLEEVLVPPTGRTMLVVPLQSIASLPQLPYVIALGTNMPEVTLPGVRVSPLGMMQRPPLDGFVDLRSPTDRSGPRPPPL